MTSWQLNSMIYFEFSIVCPRLAMLPFGSSYAISLSKMATHIEFSKIFFLSWIWAFKRGLDAFLMTMKLWDNQTQCGEFPLTAAISRLPESLWQRTRIRIPSAGP
jgi:hypothetical protein